ncbi:3D domain-containing protein [Enterococcus asini]|uniref:3D domain-containing protein n=1 Tax=Enterococcus asini TaxID=57732 RepID=UPI00289262D7|nr:3D domain-containing protein [Enterococcus asini]MDT2744498.1 3D domain-containing protein [Enterococcus asini]MDT2763397.1 3D domain-containing protein [Enterococcus asini]
MKSRFWPVVSATVVLAFGSLLPVYAAENQVEAPSMETEIVEKETVQNLSASLVELSKDNQAITLVKEDIAKKEAAAKKAAEEKAAKEAAEKAAAEKVAKEKEAAEKQAAEEAAAAEAAEQEAATSSTPAGGRTITMESTAYSSDPADALGGGSVTATGQNLLTNPMAVAVDPSVIPLGTRLYVEGYGEAYAVDTGSAIQGNIIDVHFSTAAQCYSWGRRTVQVTILS